ncbi:MAG: hypothetical protein CMQ34_11435 [Gammaproteobacteria bacterium]|nr:hypothetical protein [Gammaproteobacteria bacterium]|tara:strand:+ start:9812 stop:10213 length:402 start_codon:yes stop_codon:yes gene_type:complete
MLTTMSLTLVLVLLAGLSLGLGVMQIASMRKISQLHQALTDVSSRQESLLHANSGAIIKLGGSLQALEQRVTLTARRQQELENKDAGSLTYDQASKLIQMGAAPEDLVKTCGLSQAEAKLVSLMAARGVGKPA